MKFLILGENGMLGSQLMKTLSKNHLVIGTSSEKGYRVNSPNDIEKFDTLIKEFKPNAVINCIGIIKQKESTPEQQVLINSLLPKLLSNVCAKHGSKLVHVSTDCVFDGKVGNYTKRDITNAQDLYGMTKAVGELDNYNRPLTIRTSIIGHEKDSKYGLLEWFLHSEGKVSGYSNVWYSGITTLELAKFIDKFWTFSGLLQIAGPKINKYELLNIIKKVYNKDIIIEKKEDVVLDRSMKTSFKLYKSPTWEEMIQELREDHNEISS